MQSMTTASAAPSSASSRILRTTSGAAARVLVGRDAHRAPIDHRVAYLDVRHLRPQHARVRRQLLAEVWSDPRSG
jgi:hypothetical protein